VVGVLFLLFVLNALNCRPLADWIKSVWLLNKIFNANDFSKSYQLIIKEFFENNYFSGFTGYLIGKDNVRLSGSWLFDMLMIAQVFGWVCFIAFIVLLFVRYVQYFKTSTDDKISKVLLLGFILSIVTVTFVGYNSVPSSVNSKYFPIFFMAPFLLLLVFYGYMGKQEVIKE
jgi:quinol-cytochrome oxidoreductase complex cytochrome b subunit